MAKTNLFKSLRVIVFITIIMTCGIFIGGNFIYRYVNLQKQIDATKQDHLKQEKTFIKKGVQNFIELIKNKQDKTNNRAQNIIQARVNDAYTMANTLYHKYKGTKSEAEIQSLIIENLRAIRYKNGMGYFFVLTQEGKGVLLPLNPDLEGSNILETKNIHDRFIFQDIIKITNKGKHFYSYSWKSPQFKGDDHLKISYLKRFEPFGWIIGSGIYLDEIIDSLQKEALELANHYRFGDKEAQYIFIGKWDGNILHGPAKGKNMWNATDKDGIKIIQALVKQAQGNGGFVNYQMLPIDGQRTSEKLSYVQGMHQWEWFVGSGLYLDNINKEIASLKEELLKRFYQSLALTVVFTGIVILFFIYLLNRYHLRLKNDFETFKHFFKQATNTHKPINKDNLTLDEFDTLAAEANQMLFEQTSLENSLKEYEKIISVSKDFHILLDRDYRFRTVNKAFANKMHLTQEEITGYTVRDFFGDALFETSIKHHLDTALKGTPTEFTLWVPIQETYYYIQSSCSPFYGDSTLPEGVAINARNITDQKIAEDKLKQWATVFENTNEGVLICEPDNTIIAVNRAFCISTGYDEKEIIGNHISFLKSSSHSESFYRHVYTILKKKGAWQGEIWNPRKDGTSYSAWLTINSAIDEKGQLDHYIGVFSDISHLKESQKELDFLAHHDPLTELPNRTLLNDRLQQAIHKAERDGSMMALCFIDLDNFKNVNDSYGHSYGDAILLQVSKRLKMLIRKSDTLARIGGDEFVLVINDVKAKDDLVHIVTKLLDIFEIPFLVKKHTFFVTASIGISLFPEDGSTAEVLIKNADAAMYQAKAEGKSTFAFYTKELTDQSMMRLNLENNMKEAIGKEEFCVYYQPQINLQTGQLTGMEALVRWCHPEKGIIPPNVFIPLAEETRMIIPIGDYVLTQVCKDWHILHSLGFNGHIAVNISGIQIENGDFMASLEEILATQKMPPEKIELEITESTVMKDSKQWIVLLQNIKKRGLRISIDDFGTGYSSLNTLRHLPIDKLKIDLSFVKDLPHEKSACAIASTIIDLSMNMEMTALAEGVETEAQMKYLRQLSCDEAQGYLFAKPMPMGTLKEWMETSQYFDSAKETNTKTS